jgi:octaprenyl-diphosphate synthase
LILSIDHQDTEILRITSRAVKELSEGELLQMEKARKLDIKENIYFDIIRAKTASLLAASCAAGAFSATQDHAVSDLFWQFGEKIGIAFQIKDDLFDYGTADIGKPTGIDIKEKKMTLPLIYALQHAAKEDKRRIIYTIKNHSSDRSRVEEIIAYVRQSGGIEYAVEKMNQYQTEALAMLQQFPETPARQAMTELVYYVINRQY